MARIQPPPTREIYETAGIAPATLGKEDVSEVFSDINRNYLPNASRRVNMAIDSATAPSGVDFPFSMEVLAAAYPALDTAGLVEKADDMTGAVLDWMKYDVVVQLLNKAIQATRPGSNSPFEQRLQNARELREENKALALGMIAFVAALPALVGSGENPATLLLENRARRVNMTVPTVTVWQ